MRESARDGRSQRASNSLSHVCESGFYHLTCTNINAGCKTEGQPGWDHIHRFSIPYAFGGVVKLKVMLAWLGRSR